MAENRENGKPPINKWLFAAILFGIVAFMYISVAYKIYAKGP
jgi:hypothetical protein